MLTSAFMCSTEAQNCLVSFSTFHQGLTGTSWLTPCHRYKNRTFLCVNHSNNLGCGGFFVCFLFVWSFVCLLVWFCGVFFWGGGGCCCFGFLLVLLGFFFPPGSLTYNSQVGPIWVEFTLGS